jgi:hypothetical protein
MKFIIASFGALIILSFQVNVNGQVPELKTWSCDYGDYHITLRAAEGIPNFDFGICEFHSCDANALKHNATYISSSPKEGKYLYETPNINADEDLVLKFKPNKTLQGVDLVVNGYRIQSFENCLSF